MNNINLIRELTETLLTVAIILWAQVRNNPLIICDEITPVTIFEKYDYDYSGMQAADYLYWQSASAV